MSRKCFERTYFHVGLGKTGTSTIQLALLENASTLESKFNIHFPHNFDDSRPFFGNHTLFLSSLFGANPERLRANVIAGFNTPKSLAISNEKIHLAFRKSFEESSVNNLLISAEGVGHFHQENIEKVATWLRSFSKEIIVIACLRHPMHALASEIQQRVKNGSVLEDLYDDPPFYPFRNLFGRLEKVFGRSNIVAYDFGEAVKSEYGILGTFLKQINVSPLSIKAGSHIANESMSHEAVLLLSELNRQCPSLNGNELGSLRSPSDIQLFQSIPGSKFRSPKVAFDKLSVKVEPELEWLMKNYNLQLDPMSFDFSDEVCICSKEAIRDIALKISSLASIIDMDSGMRKKKG